MSLTKEAVGVGVLLLPLYSVVRELVNELDVESERSKEYLAIFVSGALFHVLAEVSGINEYYLHNSHAYHKFVAKEDKGRNDYRLPRSADGRVCSHAVWACSR
jgi:hypothetical protein